MNTTTYDVLALEEIAKEKFDFSVEIQSIILPMSDVGRTAAASVFLTSKNHLAVYVEASSATLADIKKIVRRMGLKDSRIILTISAASVFRAYFLA